MKFYSKRGIVFSFVHWLFIFVSLFAMAAVIWSKTDMVTIILVWVLCLPSVTFMMLIWWINPYYEVTVKQELKIVSGPIKYPIISI